VPLASFCQLANNAIHKFNPKTFWIGDWPSVISFDHLSAKNLPEFLPVIIFLANHPTLNSK
jgi:hypothetical protein